MSFLRKKTCILRHLCIVATLYYDSFISFYLYDSFVSFHLYDDLQSQIPFILHYVTHTTNQILWLIHIIPFIWPFATSNCTHIFMCDTHHPPDMSNSYCPIHNAHSDSRAMSNSIHITTCDTHHTPIWLSNRINWLHNTALIIVNSARFLVTMVSDMTHLCCPSARVSSRPLTAFTCDMTRSHCSFAESDSPVMTHTHARTHTHTNTRTHTHAHAHAHTHTHTHAQAHTHAHTHTRTHKHTHTITHTLSLSLSLSLSLALSLSLSLSLFLCLSLSHTHTRKQTRVRIEQKRQNTHTLTHSLTHTQKSQAPVSLHSFYLSTHRGGRNGNNCEDLDFEHNFISTKQRQTREIQEWDQHILAIVIIQSLISVVCGGRCDFHAKVAIQRLPWHVLEPFLFKWPIHVAQSRSYIARALYMGHQWHIPLMTHIAICKMHQTPHMTVWDTHHIWDTRHSWLIHIVMTHSHCHA